jgi:hypothetical protein
MLSIGRAIRTHLAAVTATQSHLSIGSLRSPQTVGAAASTGPGWLDAGAAAARVIHRPHSPPSPRPTDRGEDGRLGG